MKNHNKMLFSTLLSFLVFTGCEMASNFIGIGEDLGSSNPIVGPVTTMDIISISGTISSDQLWENGKMYYIEDHTYIKAIVTIEPGCIVKLGSDGLVYIQDGGKIDARGTADNNIIFTSYKSPVGGYLPGITASPLIGDWYQIIVQASGSVFSFCQFEYANTALKVHGNNTTSVGITVTDCLFTKNNQAFSAVIKPVGTELIKDNRFYSNNKTVAIHPVLDFDISNKFSSLDGSLINKYQTIELMNSSMSPNHIIVNNVVLAKRTEIDYSVNSIWLKGVSLTMEDNVILKVKYTGTLYVQDGASFMLGSGCFITVTEDDSKGINIDGEPCYVDLSTFLWDGIFDWDTPNNIGSDRYIHSSKFLYSENSSSL